MVYNDAGGIARYPVPGKLSGKSGELLSAGEYAIYYSAAPAEGQYDASHGLEFQYSDVLKTVKTEKVIPHATGGLVRCMKEK